MSNNIRIGMIVPSSNTTMETEIPNMFHERMKVEPESFTFHSSRMRMRNVSQEELKQMNKDSGRCVLELSDANCDVLVYACLIAIMFQGPGYHKVAERKLLNEVERLKANTPVMSSAGALIKGIEALGAKKVSIITPYMKSLTNNIIDYLNDCGIEVVDSISLEVSDNLEVGRLDPMNLLSIINKLNYSKSDAVILSTCVQMPSLSAIQKVEDKLDKPVLSAATATVYQILKSLKLKTIVPKSGSLLSGEY